MDEHRVQFVPRHECEHNSWKKGDMCYGCGLASHLVEESILRRKLKIISTFVNELVSSQKEMPEEFRQLINEKFFELI